MINITNAPKKLLKDMEADEIMAEANHLAGHQGKDSSDVLSHIKDNLAYLKTYHGNKPLSKSIATKIMKTSKI